jgi:DNA-directed RNA polymerase subunit F
MINLALFPNVEPVKFTSFTEKKERLLILSDGFEERSLYFLSNNHNDCFNKIIVCVYDNREKTRFDELLYIIKKRYSTEKTEIRYNRFEPFSFEIEMQEYLSKKLTTFEEIVLDISVMSKYMIMQIMSLLKEYTGDVRIIYTEPKKYAPTEEEWKNSLDDQKRATLLPLPSVGVQNIVRTPLLTSLIMQQSPSLLVSFLSFNEQLIRALMFECTPARVLLINGVPPHQYSAWRENAMCDIHKNIIKEYCHDNILDKDGLLQKKCSTLYYNETFTLLADIYNKFNKDYRIIVAPTGSKMQAIGASLIKNCCEDIHIEYPTPESYYIDGYSSAEVKEIHQVLFPEFRDFIKKISTIHKLNG